MILHIQEMNYCYYDVFVCCLHTYSSLTNRGDVCNHKIASLWHNRLQTHTLQTRGQLLPLDVQHRGQLLEVAFWTPKQLVFSLECTSNRLLLMTGDQNQNVIQLNPNPPKMCVW